MDRFKKSAVYVEIKGYTKVHFEINHLIVLYNIQSRSEGKLFERFKINWKFGKLLSVIIQKSWPKDHQGNYQEDEEVVLQHLLSWTAAKDIFHLHGRNNKALMIETYCLIRSPDRRLLSLSFSYKNDMFCHCRCRRKTD